MRRKAHAYAPSSFWSGELETPHGDPYVRWLQAALNQLLQLRLNVDGDFGTKTRSALRSFQQQQGLAPSGDVDAATEAALLRAGAPPVPAGATRPAVRAPRKGALPRGSVAAVNTVLPRSGVGFFSYWPNSPDQQYGTADTIAALQSIGAAWAAAHPNGPRIGIGDISWQGGGDMFPPHVSHQVGVDADLRLMRKDGKETSDRMTFRDAAYSRALTQELVDTIRANPVLRVRVILNNDPQLHGVKSWHGHDDHLHVSFLARPGGSSAPTPVPPPATPAPTPSPAGGQQARAFEQTFLSNHIALGQRDPNQLTDAVFWMRHPDLLGQKLAAGQGALQTEWRQILAQQVRPALAAVPPRPLAGPAPAPTAATPTRPQPSPSNTSSSGALPPPPDVPPSLPVKAPDPAPWMTSLVPILEKYRGEIPLEILLGWIAVESGGELWPVTDLCERGYFQNSPEESSRLKLDGQALDHTRLSRDPEYSIRGGIELVRQYVRVAKRLGFKPEHPDLFWHIVKCQHGAPAVLKAVLDIMKHDGVAPDSWAAITRYAVAHDDAYPKISAVRIITNANMTVTWGLQLARDWAHMAPAHEFEFEFESKKAPSEYLRWVQQALNQVLRLGAHAMAEDGKAGRRTKAAIFDFQCINGIHASGKLDARTEPVLIRQALALGVPPPPSKSSERYW